MIGGWPLGNSLQWNLVLPVCCFSLALKVLGPIFCLMTIARNLSSLSLIGSNSGAKAAFSQLRGCQRCLFMGYSITGKVRNSSPDPYTCDNILESHELLTSYPTQAHLHGAYINLVLWILVFHLERDMNSRTETEQQIGMLGHRAWHEAGLPGTSVTLEVNCWGGVSYCLQSYLSFFSVPIYCLPTQQGT